MPRGTTDGPGRPENCREPENPLAAAGRQLIPLKMSAYSAGIREMTPEPLRTGGVAASSAPGNNNWNSEASLQDEKTDISLDGHVTSILVHDLNRAIPQSDLEQGLHGLFSVFGHIRSVITVSNG